MMDIAQQMVLYVRQALLIEVLRLNGVVDNLETDVTNDLIGGW